MKKRTKVMGVIVMLALISTTAFATVGSRTAELFYNNIKVVLNGKEVTPTDANGNAVEPFIIDGTTYLPVRGVASALGLNVGWDAATNTVTLDNPGVFQGGVKVYEDNKVKIEFAGCRAPGEDDWYGYYYVDFNITNKTDYTLSFEIESFSANGISYVVRGGEEVAPQSVGKVSFTSETELPTSGVDKTSGQIEVVSVEQDYSSYRTKWVNVTR